jgi:4-amino-4-deoxychorismate lyase
VKTADWRLREIAVEEEVRAESIQNGEDCWLSNGVRGFIFGKIKLG